MILQIKGYITEEIMKIALIGDSNLLFMPYHSNYAEILKEVNADFITITWDRFQLDDDASEVKFRDKKIGHQRNFLDYMKYIKFVIRKINEEKFDKIIIFGLPIAYFMRNFLLKNFRDKYILDIRDYHKILKFVNIEKLIEGSKMSIISSPMYKEWLPKSDKYIVNHNTKINNLNEIKPHGINSHNKAISIAYIGATRDFKINIDFINSLKNNKRVRIFFHGAGEIDGDIIKYINENKIDNVELTGRYIKSDEPNLYNSSDLINVLRYNDGINNKTALPNRLYSSAFYGKPMLAYRGNYLDEIISKYDLGMVIDTFDNLEEEINAYFTNFDIDKYNVGRVEYLSQIIEENRIFKIKLIEFNMV